jgi:hypothetical protein
MWAIKTTISISFEGKMWAFKTTNSVSFENINLGNFKRQSLSHLKEKPRHLKWKSLATFKRKNVFPFLGYEYKMQT